MTAQDSDIRHILALLLPGRDKSAASRPVERHLRALRTLMLKNKRPDSLWKDMLSLLNTLGEEELDILAQLIIALLAARKKFSSAEAPESDADAAKSSASSASSRQKKKRVTIRVEYRKCGKDCRCNGGRGHGPYRYMYWWENGRLRSRYLGRA